VSRREPWLARDDRTKKELVQLAPRGLDHKAELSRRLRLLIFREKCPMQAVAWLTTEAHEGRRKRFVVSKNANGEVEGHPAILLNNLEFLQDGALLTLAVLVEKSTKLVNYSIGLQGSGKKSGAPWYARIDLTKEPEGEGPCGHPLLHCHSGSTPSPKGDPEARVPLPFLTPAEALDWLLATADPALEPTDSD
jgi:hypothetical protein